MRFLSVRKGRFCSSSAWETSTATEGSHAHLESNCTHLQQLWKWNWKNKNVKKASGTAPCSSHSSFLFAKTLPWPRHSSHLQAVRSQRCQTCLLGKCFFIHSGKAVSGKKFHSYEPFCSLKRTHKCQPWRCVASLSQKAFCTRHARLKHLWRTKSTEHLKQLKPWRKLNWQKLLKQFIDFSPALATRNAPSEAAGRIRRIAAIKQIPFVGRMLIWHIYIYIYTYTYIYISYGRYHLDSKVDLPEACCFLESLEKEISYP